MSIQLEGSRHVPLVAYRKDGSDPEQGYIIQLSSEQIELSKPDAESLGRYLLFEDNIEARRAQPVPTEEVEEVPGEEGPEE